MALYAKKQNNYLNMQSSLDTLEDKQAKALEEIYKLCNTDEADGSDDELSDRDAQAYFIDDKNGKWSASKKVAQDGDSDNSERFKEMFNRMDEEQYDIRKDHEGPLLIEDNMRNGAADANSDVEPEDLSEMNTSHEKQLTKAKVAERQMGNMFDARRKDDMRSGVR